MNKKLLLSAGIALCAAAWAGTQIESVSSLLRPDSSTNPEPQKVQRAASNDNGFIVPFTLTPTSDEFNLMTVRDMNGDATEWVYYSDSSIPNALRYGYNQKNAGNDWIMIPVATEKDSKYELVFEYKAQGSYPESLMVCYGNGNTDSDMTHQLWKNENFKNQSDFQTVKVEFTASSSDFKYIGFKAYSPADSYGIFVRKISLSESNPLLPEAATIVSSKMNELVYSAQVKLPSKTVSGDDITNTVGLEVSVDGTVTSTIDGNAAGDVVTVNETLTKGKHVISMRAFSNHAEGIQYSSPVTEEVTATSSDPYSLPFEFALSQDQFNDECTVIDANNDDKTWEWDSSKQTPCYQYSFSYDADDWMILPPMNMGTSGGKFELSMDICARYYNDAEDFDICIGTEKGINNMIPVLEVRNITHTSFKNYSVKFNADANSIKYIGIHIISPYYRSGINVKNVKVVESRDMTPTAPVIKSVVANGLEYEFNVAMPDASVDGLAYDSNLTLRTDIDGTFYSNTSASAGAEVKLPITFAIGKHTVSFKAVYGEGDDAMSSASAPYELTATLPEGYVYTLPFYMAPTQGEFETFTVLADKENDEYTWKYNTDYQCMQCATEGNKESDDWVFLPKFLVEDATRIYNVSAELYGTMSSYYQAFDICVGTEANPESMTKVVSVDDLSEYNFTEFKGEWIAPAPGKYLIGIHCRSNDSCYSTRYLRVRDIKVADSGKSTLVPGEVTDVVATPDQKGELKATVTFKMPTKALNGTELPANTEISAIVKSATGGQKVTGTPGQEMTATVVAPNGASEITISTSSAEGAGASVTVSVYCGLDIPTRPEVNVESSLDNMSLTVTWIDAETGENGGAVDKENLTHVICTRNVGSLYWTEVEEVEAGVTSYVFEADPEQKITHIGVKAVNSRGASQEGDASAVTGTPYELPMTDSFISGTPAVNPVLTGNFSFAYPSAIFDGQLTEDDGKALICQHNDEDNNEASFITLPKFTTKDGFDTKVTLTYYDSPIASKANVKLIGFGGNNAMLGTIAPAGEYGWKEATFDLPAVMLDQDWVYVQIEPAFDAAPQAFVVRNYAIANNYTNDIKLTVNVPEELHVGKEAVVTVNIKNQCNVAQEMPEVECKIEGESFSSVLNGVMATTDVIAGGETKTITYNFTPIAEMLGNAKITAQLVDHNDEVPANNTVESDCEVTPGNSLVISDLKSYVANNNVILAWSEPSNDNTEDVAAGYHIYRNDGKIVDNHNATSYTDADGVHGNWYHVAAVTATGDEHPLSNKVVADFSSSTININGMSVVYATPMGIRIVGFDGMDVDVVNIDGIKVATVQNASNVEDVALDRGIYVVAIGKNVFKINVK